MPGRRIIELGEMMDERRNFNRFRPPLESSLRPLILPERVKLTTEKTPGVDQNTGSFRKNEGPVSDVF